LEQETAKWSGPFSAFLSQQINEKENKKAVLSQEKPRDANVKFLYTHRSRSVYVQRHRAVFTAIARLLY